MRTVAAAHSRRDSHFFMPREIRKATRIHFDLRLHIQERAHIEPAATRFENAEFMRLAANDGVFAEIIASREVRSYHHRWR